MSLGLQVDIPQRSNNEIFLKLSFTLWAANDISCGCVAQARIEVLKVQPESVDKK